MAKSIGTLILDINGDTKPLVKSVKLAATQCSQIIQSAFNIQPLGKLTSNFGNFNKVLNSSKLSLRNFGSSSSLASIAKAENALRSLSKATITLNRNLTNTQAKLASIGSNFNSVSRNLTQQINKVQNNLGGAVEKSGGSRSGKVGGILQPLGKITGQANEFQKSLEASNARVIAFGASAGFIYLLQDSFKKLVTTTVEVEKSLTDIEAFLNIGKTGIADFGKRLFEVANSTATSFYDTAKAASEFSRQGLSVEETLKRTEAALMLTRISGLGVEESINAITATMNSFNKESLTSYEIVSKLSAVDAAFAVSSADLAKALSRVGSTANDANVSFDQTISLVTAAQQVTARGGSVIGNAFKSIFTRVQRPKVLEDLESLGIATRDAAGKMLPTVQVLKNLANVYDGLSSAQKSFISETVGGVYQINILKATLGDLGSSFSIYDNAMKVAENSTGSIERRMNILNGTISSKLIQTMNSLTEVASNLGNSLLKGAMSSGLDKFEKIKQAIVGDALSETNTSGVGKFAQGLMGGLGSFLQGPALQAGISVILKLFGSLVGYIREAGKDLSGVTEMEKQRKTLNENILLSLRNEPDVLRQIAQGHLSIAKFSEQTLKNLQSQHIEMVQMSSVAGAVTSRIFSKTNVPSLLVPNAAIETDISKGIVGSGPYVSAITEALNAENKATGGNATLSKSSKLISQANPLGLVAIDKRNQADAEQAIAQHQAVGQSIGTLKYARTTSNSGVKIPNLSTGGLFSDNLMMASMMMGVGQAMRGQQFTSPDKESKWERATRYIPGKKFIDELNPAALEIQRFSKQLEKSREEINKNGNSFAAFGNKFKTYTKLEDLAGPEQLLERKKSRYNELYAARYEKQAAFANKAFYGSMAASAVGGLVPKFLEGKNQRYADAVEEFSGAAQVAAQVMWTIPTKLGKALGAGIAVTGMASSIDVFQKNLGGYSQAIEAQKNNFQKLSAQVDGITTVISQLDNMVNDSTVSFKDIQKENRKYTELVAQMTADNPALGAKFSTAPGGKAQIKVLQEYKTEKQRELDSASIRQEMREYSAKRTFWGMGNGTGYSDNIELTKRNAIVQSGTTDLMSQLSEDEKKALLNSSGNSANFNNAIAGFGPNSNFKNGYNNLNQGWRDLTSENLRYNLQVEKSMDNPRLKAAIEKTRNNNETRQLEIDIATRKKINTERNFANQGSMLAGNILDVSGLKNIRSYNSSQLDISKDEAMMSVFAMGNGRMTTAKMKEAIEARKINLDRKNEIFGINSNLTRGITDQFTQSFDSNVNIGGSKMSDYGSATISRIGKDKLDAINALNTGISKTVAGGSFDRFSSGGVIDTGKIIQEIIGNSGGSDKTKKMISDNLQGNNSEQVLKLIQDYNKQIAETGEKSRAALERNNVFLQQLTQEMNFEKLASYLGGSKTLSDRGARRLMERDAIRNAYLMQNGSTQETRGMGALGMLKFYKNMNVPIDLSGKGELSQSMLQAWDAAKSGVGSNQNRMFGNISRGVSKLGGSSILRGLYDYRKNISSVGSASESALLEEFKPEGRGDIGKFTKSLISDSSEINNGAIAVTAGLESFNKMLGLTAQDVVKASEELEALRKKHQEAKQIDDNNVKNAQNAILPPKPKPGGTSWNYSTALEGGIGSLTTGIGYAIGSKVINTYGGKGIFQGARMIAADAGGFALRQGSRGISAVGSIGLRAAGAVGAAGAAGWGIGRYIRDRFSGENEQYESEIEAERIQYRLMKLKNKKKQEDANQNNTNNAVAQSNTSETNLNSNFNIKINVDTDDIAKRISEEIIKPLRQQLMALQAQVNDLSGTPKPVQV